MSPLVWGLIITLAAGVVFCTSYGTYLITSERTRKRGWAIFLLVGHDAATVYLNERASTVLTDAVTLVEQSGKRQESALADSLARAENAATALETVQKGLGANLELTSGNLDLTGHTMNTLLVSQATNCLMQHSLAQFDALLEQSRWLDLDMQLLLRSKQLTVDAITAGIDGEVQATRTAAFHRKELLAAASQIKQDCITAIDWQTLKKQTATAESVATLEKKHEHLRQRIDKVIDVLSDEKADSLIVRSRAHELQQWLNAYTHAWGAYRADQLRVMHNQRVQMLDGMKKQFESLVKKAGQTTRQASALTP
jgi:hypothetical protein